MANRFQAGDKRRWTNSTFHYFDPVYAYMLKALGDENAAQDATQQVFANVLQAAETYEARDGIPFGAWLFTIARNVAIDSRRADWRSRERLAIRARRERHAQRSPIRMRYKPARVIVSRRFALEQPRCQANFYSPIQAYRQPF